MVLGREVSWFPLYGPEMRGGRAACWVVVSDQAIGSPVVSHPDAGLLLDAVAVGERAGSVRDGGTLILNASLIQEVPRDDVNVVAVRATDLAEQLGSARVANMVMLGAYAEYSDVLPLDSLPDALKHVLPERHHQFIPLNTRAIEAGARCVATGSELVAAEP
jgi:2-oxoglutarate ferredoxin oxidoreductase subunit gamma